MASPAVTRLEQTPTHFRDRAEAGRHVAQRLADLSGRSDLLVLGIPRGVPVAYEVAKALRAPLDLVVVRELGYPGAEELAMGAIASRFDSCWTDPHQRHRRTRSEWWTEG